MNYKNFKKLDTNVIGVAPNAWPRIVASDLVTNFSVICSRLRRDTELISKDINVFCIERDLPGEKPLRANALEILRLPGVQNYIQSRKDSHLLIYKSSEGMDEIAAQFGWHVIGNPSAVKDKFENKKFFRQALIDSGIDPIPGKTFKIVDFTPELYQTLVSEIGTKLVFQITEMTGGGGTGTAFINSSQDYMNFLDKLSEKLTHKRKTPLEYVNVTKYIDGTSTSIAGCVTRNGVLTTRIQCQVQDMAEVRILTEGSGLFCGHDWSFRQYDDDIQNQAKEITRKLGEYMAKHGYKGIFGVDLLVEESESKVYPVECNPRYTDAFPVMSMIYLSNNILPLDYFHIAEHLGMTPEFDAAFESKNFNIPLYGAQIILETKSDKFTKVTGDVAAGIYRYDGEHLTFDRPGYRYEQLTGESEYLITEGVPAPDTIQKPGSRVLRVVSKNGFLEEKNKLKVDVKKVIDIIYQKLALIEIETPEEFIKE